MFVRICLIALILCVYGSLIQTACVALQLTLTTAVAAYYEDDWSDDDDTKCASYSTNNTCYATYRQGCSDGKEEQQQEIILYGLYSILLISVHLHYI